MKIFKSIITVSAILFLSLAASAQNRMFSEFAGRKDVTTVFISSAAMNIGLQFAGNDKELGMIKDCIRNPKGMEIVTVEKITGKENIREALEKKIKDLKMELLINTSSGEKEDVNIYTGALIQNNIMKDVAIEVLDGNEYTLIYIQGEIDTKKLIEAVNKNGN